MITRRLAKDDGFTLAELAMYGLLLSIVVAVAAGLMMSGTIAEKTVRTVFGASTQAQLAADSIETGIRNASGYTVTVPSTGTQLLRARVAQGTNAIVWNCAAWFYSPTVDNGSIWYKAQATAIVASDTNSLTSWIKLVDNVRTASGSTIFSVSGNQLNFAYKTLAGTDPPASIASSSASRAKVWETAPCF